MKYFLFVSLHLHPSLFQTSSPSSEAECKGRKTFPSSKKKNKTFSFSVCCSLSAVPSSSEAECKGRKKYTLRNIYRVFYSTAPHNQLEYNKKKSRPLMIQGRSGQARHPEWGSNTIFIIILGTFRIIYITTKGAGDPEGRKICLWAPCRGAAHQWQCPC